MEYYLVLKRKKKLLNQEKTWRKLQCVLSSRSSQSAKAADYVIPTPRHSGNGETVHMGRIGSGVVGRGAARWHTEGFSGSGTTLSGMRMT